MRFFLIALLVLIACAQEPKEVSIWSWEREDKPYPTVEQLENGYIEVGWALPGIPCTTKFITKIFTCPEPPGCDSSTGIGRLLP